MKVHKHFVSYRKIIYFVQHISDNTYNNIRRTNSLLGIKYGESHAPAGMLETLSFLNIDHDLLMASHQTEAVDGIY